MSALHQPSLTAAMPLQHRFRAMGTDVLLLLDAPHSEESTAALLDAEQELHRLAQVFTRFDEHSELRRLEHDRVRICSAELVEVIELAIDARQRSAGRFDPTVLPALRAVGYDRTFDDVAAAPRTADAPVPAGGGVHVNATTGLVALSTGTALDLGGIAKGWIVDRIAERLAITAPALVDAGGDITCTLRADGSPWSVDVDGADLRISLAAGAIATSGTDRRRWSDPATGRVRHHVIDPRTGTSVDSDLTGVTTIAASCAEAEVAATSILVAGSSDAPTVAQRFAAAWRGTGHDGSTLGSPELA